MSACVECRNAKGMFCKGHSKDYARLTKVIIESDKPLDLLADFLDEILETESVGSFSMVNLTLAVAGVGVLADRMQGSPNHMDLKMALFSMGSIMTIIEESIRDHKRRAAKLN